jgi:hypothetical protein
VPGKGLVPEIGDGRALEDSDKEDGDERGVVENQEGVDAVADGGGGEGKANEKGEDTIFDEGKDWVVEDLDPIAPLLLSIGRA